MVRAALLALLTLTALAGPALAQRQSSVPVFGRQPEPAPDPVPDNDTSVSFIDSALPRTMLRTRIEFASHVRQPTRAEYFQPQGGLPGSPGPPIPERNVNYQNWDAYFEFAPLPWLSLFFESPYRWVNPDFNRNTEGMGDINLGLKLVTWQDPNFLATIQLKGYLPTARNTALGTDHFSIEPGLLLNYRLASYLTLEGELRYQFALGGTDFAGDVLRYGLGVTYGQRSSSEIWLTPVVELVGWSVMSGQTMQVTWPDAFTVESARGDFIANANVGLRWGLGHNADIYAGYSRCVTGNAWYRDLIRFEFRLIF